MKEKLDSNLLNWVLQHYWRPFRTDFTAGDPLAITDQLLSKELQTSIDIFKFSDDLFIFKARKGEKQVSTLEYERILGWLYKSKWLLVHKELSTGLKSSSKIIFLNIVPGLIARVKECFKDNITSLTLSFQSLRVASLGLSHVQLTGENILTGLRELNTSEEQHFDIERFPWVEISWSEGCGIDCNQGIKANSLEKLEDILIFLNDLQSEYL